MAGMWEEVAVALCEDLRLCSPEMLILPVQNKGRKRRRKTMREAGNGKVMLPRGDGEISKDQQGKALELLAVTKGFFIKAPSSSSFPCHLK